MKKFVSFLWVVVLVFNVAGSANAVPIIGWVTDESFSFSYDDTCQGAYALNAYNEGVGIDFSCPLNLECSPSPSGGICEPAGHVQEPAAMFFLGAGLVALSGFRKKIKKKGYCVLAKSGGLVEAAIYK